jgi:hypothetical protein
MRTMFQPWAAAYSCSPVPSQPRRRPRLRPNQRTPLRWPSIRTGVGFGIPIGHALFRSGGRNAEKPVFTPAAQKIADAFAACQKRGENLQTEVANCVPAGMPQIM